MLEFRTDYVAVDVSLPDAEAVITLLAEKLHKQGAVGPDYGAATLAREHGQSGFEDPRLGISLVAVERSLWAVGRFRPGIFDVQGHGSFRSSRSSPPWSRRGV